MAATTTMIDRPTREQMIARAWDLVPKLRERAAQTERLGHIHPDTVQDLHDTRLWRIHQPRRHGGLELDFALYLDIGEALARGCASTAWVWVNLVAHNWMLGMFVTEAQDEIWNLDRDTLIGSALIYPCGHPGRRRLPALRPLAVFQRNRPLHLGPSRRPGAVGRRRQ